MERAAEAGQEKSAQLKVWARNQDQRPIEVQQALEQAKAGAFRTKKRMSTVTNIELVPRESHKDATRGNHRSKRSIEGSAALQLGQ